MEPDRELNPSWGQLWDNHKSWINALIVTSIFTAGCSANAAKTMVIPDGSMCSVG